MRNEKSEYHYLTKFGVLKGFNKSHIDNTKRTFLVLDSSVCLDIVNIINKKNINKISKRKAFELIKYSQKKSMPIFELFASLELSINKITQQLDENKFLDFSRKIKFAFQVPLKDLKKNNFNFSMNSYPDIKMNNNVTSFVDQIYVHYCVLLKIREIASNGLGKQKSKKNITQFLDWMDFKLGIILGLEYQLALQIFGGNTNFNTMIKENSNKERTLKALWGSAWDLLHARVSRDSSQLSEIVNEDINSIFVTNDKRLHELLAPQIEFASEFDRTKISITDGKENYPPHYDDDFISELNQRIIKIFEKRELNSPNYPKNSIIKNLIKNLEEKIK